MSNNIRHILIKYINGNATEKEIALVKNWIAESKQNERYYAGVYEEWHQALSTKHQLIDADKAYKRFIKENTKKSIFSLNTLHKYAAIFVLVSVTAFLFYKRSENIIPKKKGSTWKEITVAKGETKKIVLPDGTTVSINAGSSLRYNENFGKEERTVELNGEALFDIANDKQNAPFIVKAAGFIIEDIGTIFNVKAYSADEEFETSVIEGEVSVEGKLSGNNNSKVFIAKNQALKIKSNKILQDYNNQSRRKTDKIVTRPLQIVDISAENMEQYNGWTNDILTFDNSDFQKIANELERKFDVKIDFKESILKSYHYTGTFKNAKSVYKILNIIKETTPISYSSNGKNIIIHCSNLN